VDVALRDAIENGTVEGPTMQVPGAMITMTGGAGALTGISHEIDLPKALKFGQANSPGQLRERVRDVISRGADVIKVFASGAVIQHGCCSPSSCEFTVEELEAVVDEAAQFGRKVMAHAHSAQGVKNAVSAGVASIEHGTMLDEEGAEMMKARGTFLVPTLSVWDSFGPDSNRPEEFMTKAREVKAHHDVAFGTALRVGVRIALGSDSVVCPHDQGARELHHMVRLGMSPMEALKAATVNAAELMGLEAVGALAVGHRADLIAVRGDPVADVDSLMEVAVVVQRGVIRKSPNSSNEASLKNVASLTI
jgi:imidazolonepropionase-like amidohydrolase